MGTRPASRSSAKDRCRSPEGFSIFSEATALVDAALALPPVKTD
jgi:hypothetical protein